MQHAVKVDQSDKRLQGVQRRGLNGCIKILGLEPGHLLFSNPKKHLTPRKLKGDAFLGEIAQQRGNENFKPDMESRFDIPLVQQLLQSARGLIHTIQQNFPRYGLNLEGSARVSLESK